MSVETCRSCGGMGKMVIADGDSNFVIVCGSCDGKGVIETDVADVPIVVEVDSAGS